VAAGRAVEVGVVKQNHVAWDCSLGGQRRNPLWRSVAAPVLAPTRPQQRAQSGPVDGSQSPGAVHPVWGPVQDGLSTKRLLQRVQAPRDVGVKPSGGHSHMEPVAVGVQRHRMAARRYIPRQLRPAINLLSDHEEGGLGAGAFESLEDGRGPFWVRTVVEGQHHSGLGYRPGNVQCGSSARRHGREQMAKHGGMMADAAVSADDLDGWLSNPAIRIGHSRPSTAHPEALWRAARSVRVRDTAVLGRLVQWRIPGIAADMAFDELFRRAPFCVLEEGDLALVSGIVGRIWTLRRDYPTLAGPDDFRSFDAPGTARVMFAMWAAADGSGGRLSVEVRVAPVGVQGRFGVAAVRPLVAGFHALIGSDGLGAAVRRAEAR
jgi:hypothetical protein